MYEHILLFHTDFVKVFSNLLTWFPKLCIISENIVLKGEDIVKYYKNTGKLPTTSGSSPEDFIQMFDTIHEALPDAHILYLAYSAVTTTHGGPAAFGIAGFSS